MLMEKDNETLRMATQQFLGVWDIYIKFYTTFLTVNLAALAVIVEKMQNHRARNFVCLAFLAQNILSLGTAVGLSMYSNAIMSAFVGSPADIAMLAARPLGIWGGLANAASHVTFIALWYFVRRGNHPGASAVNAGGVTSA